MTPQNAFDLKGIFRINPFPELLVEIGQAKLGGSLRLSHGERKSIIYFRQGEIVYGVSNAREHRLLSIILELKLVETQRLARLPKFTNDVEYAAALTGEGILSKAELDKVIATQIERILLDALSWPDGEFVFSPFVKPREDLVFQIDFHKVLIDYARCMPASHVLERFKSMQESFVEVAEREINVPLHNHEDYVLKCFANGPKNIDELKPDCGLLENGLLATLYVLWLGGLLVRRDWNAVFSENKIAAIRSARVSLVKQAQKTVDLPKETAEKIERSAKVEPEPEATPEEIPAIQITIEEFLDRTEKASTHYDVLGVSPKSAVAEIKNAYFGLAKLFHPDLFHRNDVKTLQRIQSSFSSVAQAYETLKSRESRDNYDFKIRKELETKEKLRAQGVTETERTDMKTGQGLENFEQGLSLLMDGEYGLAAAYLGRAAHYNPNNALYRAYYGKALSYDKKQWHKAEGEMQAGARLDPKNPKIRLMLIEFFIEMNLLKRAEGELKRFLEIAPNNADARRLLKGIQN